MANELPVGMIDYIETVTGLRSPPSNNSQLIRVLSRLAGELGVSTNQCFDAIRRNETVREQFLNEILIGETYFFRESSHFELLNGVLIPQFRKNGRRIACWSASCSTGEEPVSLAALLAHHSRDPKWQDFEVFASDINTNSLKKLRSGLFPQSAFRKDGADFHHILKTAHLLEQAERTLQVTPRLLNKIRSHHLNLFSNDLSAIPNDLDFVFFRNTLLYAAIEKRFELVERIVPKLREGGYLFVAGSELPFVKHPQLEQVELNKVYLLQKRRHPAEPTADGTGPAMRATAATSALPTASTAGGATSALPTASTAGGADSPRRETAARREAPPPANSDAGRTPVQPATLDPTAEVLALLANAAEVAHLLKTVDPSPVATTARMVIDCFEAINATRFDRAARTLDDLLAVAPGSTIAHYCSGWLAYNAGDRDRANTDFSAVLAADQDFWPARYYRTVMTIPTEPVSRRPWIREFNRCVLSIDRDNRRSTAAAERFTFLLEGFGSVYFRRMCERRIELLEKEDT